MWNIVECVYTGDKTKLYKTLLSIQPTCNYRLPQTSAVLLYTEQSSDISEHEATRECLGKGDPQLPNKVDFNQNFKATRHQNLK